MRWPHLFVLLGPLLGWASEARGDDANSRVEVTIAGEAKTSAALEASLRELLGRLPVSPFFSLTSGIDVRQIVTPPPGFAIVAARIWIELGASRVATVYLADGRWERVLVRRVPVPHDVDEVEREQLAHIVESSVDALLSGATIGLSLQEASRSLGVPEATFRPEVIDTAPTVAPSEIRPLPLAASLRYEAELWSTGVLSSGLGGSLDLFPLGASPRFGIALTGVYHFPFTVEHDPVGLRLQGGALRVLAAVEPLVGPRWRIRGALGGGVDFLRAEASALRPEAVAVAPPRVSPTPSVHGVVDLRILLFGPYSALLGVAADYDLADTRYALAGDTSGEQVFHPWRLRPIYFAGIALQRDP